MTTACTCPPLRDLMAQGLTDEPITPCPMHRPERATRDIDAPGLALALNSSAIPAKIRDALSVDDTTD